MKILLIGANGTIGSAIDRELSARHEIVRIAVSYTHLTLPTILLV